MATHSSVLAWRIPGTGKPGGLPSMGLHRVGHEWIDLAAAAAAATLKSVHLGLEAWMVHAVLLAVVWHCLACSSHSRNSWWIHKAGLIEGHTQLHLLKIPMVPFSSCPQSFPASGSFQMSQLFASGGQNIGVSASTSVLPMNTQNWSPLGWTGWISLQSKGLSRVFSNSTVQKHLCFSAQLSLWSNSYIHTWPLEKP